MGKTRGRRAQPEHVEQSLLFQWAELAAGTRPALRAMFAIPNFSGRLGKVPPVAAIRQAQALNREGRKKGVPDVCLPIARGSYHSLYIEMKAGPTSRVSPEQKGWHDLLRAHGHAVRVCYSWEAAKDVILQYLDNAAA